jgi:hypothetical protein
MRFRLSFAVFLVLLGCQERILAQEARGTIVGTVADATGAVVPGAPVLVTNMAMGTKVSTTTNAEGVYQAPYLIPGSYQIVVEQQGFKRYVRDGVVVRTNDRLQVNITLEVGGTTESITITGETPLLDTASASMAQVVDSRRVAELPIAHGQPFALIGLAAGVSFNAGSATLNRPFEPTHIAGYSINGVRRNRADLTIDGVPATATANANEVISSYVPPADIVQEVRVQTATFDSSFGQTEGGVFNIAIKSGTNNLHGTAYYSKWTPALTANDWFNNAADKPKPDYTYNRWGGSVGGPVWLPKIYNGKNKTFFLWGYEGIHESRPRNNCGNNCAVPTDAMWNGDFSSLLAVGPQYQLYNPFTRRAEGNRFRQDPFPGNIIPQDLISPVAKAMRQYWPKEPLGGGSPNGQQNHFEAGLLEPATYYSHTIRGDHVVSDRQRIFARVSFYKRDSNYNDYFHTIATGEHFKFFSRNAAIDDVITLSPTMVLNLRYGYNRFIRTSTADPGGFGIDLTTLGFPKAYNDAIPEDLRRFPGINMSGYTSTFHSDFFRPIDTHAFIATLNKVAGAHSLKTGVEYRAYRENDRFFGNDATGRFFFDSTWTRGPLDNVTAPNPPMGFSAAALLLGLPSEGSNSFVSRLANYAEQSPSWGVYLHDDWKVTRKLTLNVGLRWEYEGPLTERYNRSVRDFDYGFVQPIEAAARAAYAAKPVPELAELSVRGGLTFAGVDGRPRGLYSTSKTNLMPRFGFAYQLRPTTVIRGGYGIFYGFLGQRRGDVVQHGFTGVTNFVPSNDGGLSFIATLSNPFPDGIKEPVGAAGGGTTFLTQNIRFFDPEPRTPYMQRWQLGFQHEFPGGFVADLGYVGNRGTRIEIERDINALPLQYLSRDLLRTPAMTANDANLRANITNPFRGLLPGTGLNGSTTQKQNLLKPFPQFGTMTTTTNQGYSWYHSLQMGIHKRFSKGYTFEASYTFSKFMQATEYLNAADPMPVQIISDQDTPHRIAVSSIYELPFGKGKPLGAAAGAVLDKFIGGWQVQGIYVFQSGTPITWGPTTGTLRDTGLPFRGDPSQIGLDNPTRDMWFNVNAGFDSYKASSKALVNNVRYFPLRFGTLRSDPLDNWDLSVLKNVPVAEGKDLQFRFEFLNAMNHPNFQAPDTNPTSGTFGMVNGVQNYSRRVQLGAKFVF